jgi:hypothetical protein
MNSKEILEYIQYININELISGLSNQQMHTLIGSMNNQIQSAFQLSPNQLSQKRQSYSNSYAAPIDHKVRAMIWAREKNITYLNVPPYRIEIDLFSKKFVIWHHHRSYDGNLKNMPNLCVTNKRKYYCLECRMNVPGGLIILANKKCIEAST